MTGRCGQEADLHAALTAHYWGEGRASRAETEWDRVCVRLDAMGAYVSTGAGASQYDKRDTQGKVASPPCSLGLWGLEFRA